MSFDDEEIVHIQGLVKRDDDDDDDDDDDPLPDNIPYPVDNSENECMFA
jgi:hypothetical protein